MTVMSVDNSLSFFIIFFLISACFSYHLERRNMFALKINKNYRDKVNMFTEPMFSVFEITPETFVIEYHGNAVDSRVLELMSSLHKIQDVSLEPVRIYIDDLQPANDNTPQPNMTSIYNFANMSERCLIYKNSHVMDVEDVWKQNITGKGVVIAITDIGLNVDLAEFKNKIISSLSYNFLHSSYNVTPEWYPDMTCEDIQETNHGNEVARVITGIARDSKIVALKVFEMEKYPGQNTYGHYTSGDVLAKAFVFNLEDIDILVNAWMPTKNFEPLDVLTESALKEGVENGRRGLGAIYLVPAGKAGNALSNNIYTITIGSINQFGAVPPDATIDASVITSGLSDGYCINSSSTEMATTSQNKTCTTYFKGASLATAHIGAIIAFGLEVEKHLSQRDILHLLVLCSEHATLDAATDFTKNGNGKYFHESLGFGVLNVSCFVNNARRHITSTPEMKYKSFRPSQIHLNDGINEVSFCFACAVEYDGECVTNVEYVNVSVDFETDATYLKISVISPQNTTSVLMADKLDHKNREQASSVKGNFVSSHFWDESPIGSWKIRVTFQKHTKADFILNTKVTFYGTYRSDRESLKTKVSCPEITTISTEKNNEDVEKDVRSTESSSNSHLWINIVAVVVSVVSSLVLIVGGICLYKRLQIRFRNNELHEEPTHVYSSLDLIHTNERQQDHENNVKESEYDELNC